MGFLTYKEVEYLIRGLNTNFRNSPTKSPKKHSLRMQYIIRDSMLNFIENKYNINQRYFISSACGKLMMRKLEYTFKKRKCTQDLLYRLTHDELI
jgi:hypothetical protein